MTEENHPSIDQLLTDLDPDTRGWIVMDQFDPESCTVGFISFKRSDHLVYVSTLDLEPGRYSYICEVADEKKVGKSFRKENVSFEQLLSAMQAHLTPKK